jgi:predicted enzyme related to lactoylglutathione lyase
MASRSRGDSVRDVRVRDRVLWLCSRAQQTELNFRVRDLDAMLAQLRAKGADVAKETQDMEGVGRFGWVTDPEGNRVELWQPS